MVVCALLTVLALAGNAAGMLTDYCYRGAAGGTETFAVTGERTWAPRSVEARVRPLGGEAGSTGIVLHYQDSSNLYLFLYGTGSAALRIYRKTGGVYTLLASTPLVAPLGEEHVMRAETDGGGLLQLYWDDVLRLSAPDATFDAGQIGLRVWNMTADFDDVVVEDAGGSPLFTDDFDDGNAAGWNAGSGWTIVAQSGSPMPEPAFDTDFEGGNIHVMLVDPPTWSVHVTPELRGTSPYRAWFYFRMTNLSAAQPTNLVFADVDFFTRPYYSYDNIHWTEFPAPSGSMYSVTFTQDPVWIAHSIPYTTSHEQALIADLQGPYVEMSVIATSEGGRPIHRLTITAPDGLPGKRGVWFVARQHAWEASASWIADGLGRWLASPDPQAARLRAKAVVNLVAIMDVDQVALGGSGKDQLPIDFNRDWRSTPHWNAVRATIEAIDAFAAAGPYDLFIDAHCPGTASTFLYVQPDSMVSPEYWQRFEEFRQILVANAGSGPLPYSGQYSQVGPTYDPLWNQISLWHQYAAHPELELSLGLETQASSHAGYQGLAEGIGRAFDDFLPDATTGIAVAASPSPVTAWLGAGTPNPFAAFTRFAYDLPEATPCAISVYDVRGRKLVTLGRGTESAGHHVAHWDGRDAHGHPLPAGVYLVRLELPGHSESRKAVIAR